MITSGHDQGEAALDAFKVGRGPACSACLKCERGVYCRRLMCGRAACTSSSCWRRPSPLPGQAMSSSRLPTSYMQSCR